MNFLFYLDYFINPLKGALSFNNLYTRVHSIVFIRLHPCVISSVPQVFTYPSISPVQGISGVISPTTLNFFASPVATPRTTPRSTPIPRWTTPFIPLDENMDYSMIANLVHGVNSEEALLNEGMWLSEYQPEVVLG